MYENNRILIVDDTPSIHEDFKKILIHEDEADDALEELLADVLEDEAPQQLRNCNVKFELDHAFQGGQAYEMVIEAVTAGKPYAVAFVDIRMPPGWDGIQTIKKIWEVYPHLEIVICTAYSDYSWDKIIDELGTNDQLQFIRKPYDPISVKQMALALTRKWSLAEKSRHYVQDLEKAVDIRTKELQQKIEELNRASQEIKTLQGILPMCSYCHKIRSDDNYWQKVDAYISSTTEMDISHSICPDCFKQIMADGEFEEEEEELSIPKEEKETQKTQNNNHNLLI